MKCPSDNEHHPSPLFTAPNPCGTTSSGFAETAARWAAGWPCAVRSQLQPTRLPDPPGSELLLVRLGAISFTVAVYYRPLNDDASPAHLTAALDNLPGCDKLVLVGDINSQKSTGGLQTVL